jgi:hypothetical protein
LPLLGVIGEALVLPWRHRVELFRAAGLPLLALIAASLCCEFLAWNLSWKLQWFAHFLYLFILGWMATTVHRLVLLDEAGARNHFRARSWQRVCVYFLAVAFLLVLFLAIKYVSLNVIGIASGLFRVPAGGERHETARLLLDLATTLAAFWLVARFVLVLPSIAVDRGHELRSAWRISRGNAWRLAVVYGILPWAFDWGRWLMYRDGASNEELALLVVLRCLLGVIEVVALSLSFAALTQGAPPPTDPPA